MCDFSAYGGASKEWLAVEATLPPPPPANLSALERRAVTNAWREKNAAEGMRELAGKVRLVDYAIPTRDGSTVEARTYRAVDATDTVTPLYIHLHGGGYLFGTLASEDDVCAGLTLRTGVVVLNVNYRHTPEHVYPTAWHDVQDALVWVHAHAESLNIDPQRIVVGGISAGAHLAASLVLEQHLGRLPVALPPLAGQVLMIPCVVNAYCYAPQLAQLTDPAVSSVRENADAPILPMRTMLFFTDLVMAGQTADPADTNLNPGNATPEQVRGLPPTVFGICGLDPLRDEGFLYAKKLAEAGVPTDVHLFKGVPHGFRRYGTEMSVAKAWDEVMEQGILWAVSKPAAMGRFDIKVHT
ncbi:Alpha/beta hydrolase fold-3 [Niveomyces insectorum RCEF 264]|uniref:Alpha/beta hydrolase fold-3 n=1 Tax=Niveomyces insectorum RCEF 264 TaxID=1081102 RepID=A0A167SRT1_9HYPO|nr:Alpha/beta hydrolase fold-3 [Niveomyces insectorum RCEF 264]